MSLTKPLGSPASHPAARAFAVIAAVTTVALLFTPWTPPAHAARRDPLVGDVESGIGGQLPILVPSRRDEWSGGAQSLPYGDHVPSSTILAAARNLAAVQPALAEFESRGYLRRPDLDYASAGRGYAVAVLGYQRPGVPTSQQQACVEVVTRPLIIQGIDCPATQVFGGVLQDSAGLVVPVNLASDPPLIVAPDPPSGADGAIPDPIDESFIYKYSAREFLSDALPVHASMSPGAAALYNAEARTVLNGEIEGMLLGLPSGGMTMIFGAIVGMTFADRQFWISPPDTCGCGHHVVAAPPDRLATPPPARREERDSRGRFEARVIDAQGRMIRNLGGAWLGSGLEVVPWDGRDASGRPAAAGVYFVTARKLGAEPSIERLVRRVVVAR